MIAGYIKQKEIFKMQEQEWINLLVDQVETEILSIAKFKTHKARKLFMNKIKSLIKNHITNNLKEEVFDRRSVKDTVTVLVPGKTNDTHKILTEGVSAYADDFQKKHFSKIK